MPTYRLAPIVLAFAFAIGLAPIDPRSSAASVATTCSAVHWRRPSVRSVEQPLSPVSSEPADSADTLFDAALARLPAILRRYEPETWGRGRIALQVIEGSSDAQADVRVDVDLRAGAAQLRGVVSVHARACTPACGGPGRLVMFDFRDADGDLQGLVDWIAFELCVVPDPRPGWATLRASVLYVPGPHFPSLRTRRRRVEQFLGAQLFPFVAAVRDEYRRERGRRMGALP